jgi:hypothetical protein
MLTTFNMVGRSDLLCNFFEPQKYEQFDEIWLTVEVAFDVDTSTLLGF